MLIVCRLQVVCAFASAYILLCFFLFYFGLFNFFCLPFQQRKGLNARISQTSVLGNIKTETERESAKRVANFPSELQRVAAFGFSFSIIFFFFYVIILVYTLYVYNRLKYPMRRYLYVDDVLRTHFSDIYFCVFVFVI